MVNTTAKVELAERTALSLFRNESDQTLLGRCFTVQAMHIESHGQALTKQQIVAELNFIRQSVPEGISVFLRFIAISNKIIASGSDGET